MGQEALERSRAVAQAGLAEKRELLSRLQQEPINVAGRGKIKILQQIEEAKAETAKLNAECQRLEASLRIQAILLKAEQAVDSRHPEGVGTAFRELDRQIFLIDPVLAEELQPELLAARRELRNLELEVVRLADLEEDLKAFKDPWAGVPPWPSSPSRAAPPGFGARPAGAGLERLAEASDRRPPQPGSPPPPSPSPPRRDGGGGGGGGLPGGTWTFGGRPRVDGSMASEEYGHLLDVTETVSDDGAPRDGLHRLEEVYEQLVELAEFMPGPIPWSDLAKGLSHVGLEARSAGELGAFAACVEAVQERRPPSFEEFLRSVAAATARQEALEAQGYWPGPSPPPGPPAEPTGEGVSFVPERRFSPVPPWPLAPPPPPPALWPHQPYGPAPGLDAPPSLSSSEAGADTPRLVPAVPEVSFAMPPQKWFPGDLPVPAHEQRSSLDRWRETYEQLLELANTDVVHEPVPRDELESALEYVGLQVSDPAELDAIEWFLERARRGIVPHFPDFLQLLGQAPSDLLLEAENPEEAWELKGDAVPSAGTHLRQRPGWVATFNFKDPPPSAPPQRARSPLSSADSADAASPLLPGDGGLRGTGGGPAVVADRRPGHFGQAMEADLAAGDGQEDAAVKRWMDRQLNLEDEDSDDPVI